MRWADLALVACGCGHAAAPAPAVIGNAAPASPASGPLDLVFATTQLEDEGGKHRSVLLDLPARLASDEVTLFERFRGKIQLARAELVDQSGSGDELYFEYELRLPSGPSEDPNDVVALVTPAHGASAEVSDDDRRTLAQLRDPTSFAAVLDIGRFGLDLDGDRRADLAFVDVCIEYPDGDSVCGETATYIARRDGNAWHLTELCVDSGGGNCATGKLMGP